MALVRALGFAVGLVAATIVAPGARAQTQDIQEGARSSEASWRAKYRELRSALKRPFATGRLPPRLTLREALLPTYEGSNADGTDFPILVDVDEFTRLGLLEEAVYDLPVQLPVRRCKMSAEEILDLLILQFPSKNATWVVKGDLVEMTSKRAAAAHRARILGALRSKVDTRFSEPTLSLEETLIRLQRAVRGELPAKDFDYYGFMVSCDADAFQAEGQPRFDPMKLPITLPPREAISLGEILDLVVSQIPGRNADYVVLPCGIEVTTPRQAAALRERLFR